MGVLVNSCIRVRQNRGERKKSVARLQEEGKHAVSKINRAVSMKIAIEDSKRCNILEKRERLKTVSKRRGVDDKKVHSILYNKTV